MLRADDIILESLLYRAWLLQIRNRLWRGIAVGMVFSLAIFAATALLIEAAFR